MKSNAPQSASLPAPLLTEVPESQSSFVTHSRLVHAGIRSIGIAVLFAIAGQYSGAYSENLMSADIRLPFVWRDVAFVSLLSAVPICVIAVPMFVGRLKPVFSWLIAALLGFIFWTVFDCSVNPTTIVQDDSGFPTLNRVLASLCICMAMTIVGYHAAGFVVEPANRQGKIDSSKILLRMIAGLIVLTLVPGTYCHARSEDDLRQFVSLRQQSRYGEARWLLSRVQALGRSLRLDGRPLHREQREMTRLVESLELRTRNPVPASAGVAERIQRGRELAMLGQAELAIAMLLMGAESLQNADACSLLGTIYENRRDWNSALRYYALADRVLAAASEQTQDAAQAYQVAMGTAYCYRQLGQMSEAKSRYLRLLSIDPGAETHFLLAQFFEDIQETETALWHAETARRIEPNRYGQKAGKLIDNLQSKHFGCFSVFR